MQTGVFDTRQLKQKGSYKENEYKANNDMSDPKTPVNA
jgi:hypothetical protein